MPVISTENPQKQTHTGGAQIAYSLTGLPPWTFVNDLTDLDSPPMKIGPIPASTLATPHGVMRKRPGWIDPGEHPMKVALTQTQLITLFNAFFNRNVMTWRLYYPPAFDGTTLGFDQYQAYISALQPGQGMQRDQNELILVQMSVQLVTLDGNFYYGTGTGYPLVPW